MAAALGIDAAGTAASVAGDPERRALFRATRAVTVLSPPGEVWRWLIQLSGSGMATRMAEVNPARALVIKNWGANVIEPIDDSTCRLDIKKPAERSYRATSSTGGAP